MAIKIRKVGNSQTLTVPAYIKITGEEYDVKNVGESIMYTPIVEKVNIFSTPDWQEYDYQKDIEEDHNLQEVHPVGKEVVDQ